MEKLILDIRFFSDTEEDHEGNRRDIFELPIEAHAIGSRVARKLRELNFTLIGFDHVYVNFTNNVKEGYVGNSLKPSTESWFKYFDVGIEKNKVKSLTGTELLCLIEEYTFKVLDRICPDDQRQILEETKSMVSEQKTELEILHKFKETKSYKVRLTYQIRPKGSKTSKAKIYYLDKKTGDKFTSEIELEHYQDIFFLASNITVQKGNINLKPRASFRAEIYNQSYQVPISIEIA